MDIIKVEEEVRETTVNMNMGYRNFFTEEEQKQFTAQGLQGRYYSLEKTIVYHTYTTHIRLEQSELEQTLGLRHLLGIIDRLSKERPVRAKQLFPYYEKVGENKLRPLMKGLYEEKEWTIVETGRTEHHYTAVNIYVGKTNHYDNLSGGGEALRSVVKNHLKRCLAILIEKGYLTTTKDVSRGRRYTYSETYYILTDKAKKSLKKGVTQ